MLNGLFRWLKTLLRWLKEWVYFLFGAAIVSNILAVFIPNFWFLSFIHDYLLSATFWVVLKPTNDIYFNVVLLAHGLYFMMYTSLLFFIFKTIRFLTSLFKYQFPFSKKDYFYNLKFNLIGLGTCCFIGFLTFDQNHFYIAHKKIVEIYTIALSEKDRPALPPKQEYAFNESKIQQIKKYAHEYRPNFIYNASILLPFMVHRIFKLVPSKQDMRAPADTKSCAFKYESKKMSQFFIDSLVYLYTESREVLSPLFVFDFFIRSHFTDLKKHLKKDEAKFKAKCPNFRL